MKTLLHTHREKYKKILTQNCSLSSYVTTALPSFFLNQVFANIWLRARAWFPKIVPVCSCVRISTDLLIYLCWSIYVHEHIKVVICNNSSSTTYNSAYALEPICPILRILKCASNTHTCVSSYRVQAY